MIRIAAITANLGGFDPEVEWARQEMPVDVRCEIHKLTDENFPPRSKAMTPRLQARIPKCFGWQIFPGYDYYVWIDASCAPLHPGAVAWFLEQCGGTADIALFRHPDRRTVRAEYRFLKDRIAAGDKYLCSRYEGEFLDEQMAAIDRMVASALGGRPRPEGKYQDDILYASTAFIYRKSKQVCDLLKEWWHHISRYHVVDQLALPYLVWRSRCPVKVIEENYLKIPYLTYVRNRK